MSEELKLEIMTIEIWHIIAILFSIVGFFILYIRANRDAFLKSFFYVEFTMILWMVSKILKTVSPNVELRWGFVVLQYFAICLLEAAFLEFSYAYYKERSFSLKSRILFHVMPVIQFLIIATNPIHFLFYDRFDFRGDTFGPLFYVHFIIEYGYIMVGIYFCVKAFQKRFQNRNRLYSYFIAGGILLPIVFNFIYVSRLLQEIFDTLHIAVIFDITPIVFTWSLLTFVYVTSKDELFSTLPIMRHQMIDNLDVPVCILDGEGELLFRNEIFQQEFYQKENLEQMQRIFEFYRIHSDQELFLEINQKQYRIQGREMNTINGKQYIFTVEDSTFYLETEERLLEGNVLWRERNNQLLKQIEMLKQTSKLSASNYVARELHDIIGHSLVVAMKLLEVSKISFKKDRKRAKVSCDNAVMSLQSGLYNMKKIKEQNQKEDEWIKGILVEKEIKKYIKRVEAAGVGCTFYFDGREVLLQKDLAQLLPKICMELFTNVLKHSKSDKTILSLRIKEELTLGFMDDGVGFEELKKGNGLKGIESRVQDLGGKISYHSESGFGVHIVLPTSH